MRKTSVYLDNDEAEGLKRVAAATGRAQADLIREGVRKVIAETQPNVRVFKSLGKGRGGGRRVTGWNATSLYKKVTGRP